MPTERVLADFEGLWTITRDIVPRHGPHASFVGRGVWTPCDHGLDYRETGTLTVAGSAPMQAERACRWMPDLSVHFDDGRFFHQVPAGGGRTRHFCDPDTYVVDYDFDQWPAFQTTWTVSGPRKSYAMTSRFMRPATP